MTSSRVMRMLAKTKASATRSRGHGDALVVSQRCLHGGPTVCSLSGRVGGAVMWTRHDAGAPRALRSLYALCVDVAPLPCVPEKASKVTGQQASGWSVPIDCARRNGLVGRGTNETYDE